MGILGWVVLGAIAAWLERRLLPGVPHSSFVGSMVLAFAGAMLGNLVAYAVGLGDFTGFNLRSIFISTLGIAVILVSYRRLRGASGRPRS